MYTLCFDVFPPASESESESKSITPWIKSVFTSKNIFQETHHLSINKKKLSDNSDIINSNYKQIDYRYSSIEIIPIDSPNLTMNASTSTLNRTPPNPNINNPLLAQYLGEGVIRLFKDSMGHENSFKIGQLDHVPGDNSTVSILAVPFYFSTSDLLLGFFEHELLDQMSFIRIIKLSQSNRTMVLIKFKMDKFANSFINNYNGRKFTSLDPETCTVIKIKDIVFRKSNILQSSEDDDNDRVQNALPYLLPDPFTDTHQIIQNPSTYVELATCPVCLERLDSDITGIVTIQCQHSYHCSCLSKWKEDRCPVCRYSSKSKIDNDTNNEDESRIDTSKCLKCEGTSNLWICLVCGHVGCGRYENEHAVEHFKLTGHCFAMDSETQRVWDYVRDGYVHRLVQNEIDGKLVELPLRDESNKNIEVKVDKIGFEYSKMLIAQLESQRDYYNEIIDQYKNDLNYHVESMSKMIEKTRSLEDQFQKLKMEFDDNKLNLKQLQLKSNNDWKAKFDDELILNDGLSKNIELLTVENQNLKNQNDDLNEQIADLMGHFQMEDQLKNMGEEAHQGEIVIVPAKPSSNATKSKKKLNKRK